MLLLFRIHEESFKVQIQVRNQCIHKVIDGGALLQHACNQSNKRLMLAPGDTRGRTKGQSPDTVASKTRGWPYSLT